MFGEIVRRTPNFWQQCRNFIRDLRSFGSDVGARKRVEGTNHQICLGEPYFDEVTRQQLLDLPTRDGTLLKTLQRLVDKRDSGVICAAHDLAPIFEGQLGVKWDNLEPKATVPPAKTGYLGWRTSVASVTKSLGRNSGKSWNKSVG